MSESGYPEVWDFEAEGKATLEGKFVKVDAVQAKKYGTDTMVEKFVVTLDVDGTEYVVWLDSAVLNRAFREEARNRKAIGQGFAPGEAITIEYLGKRQGATYKYKDFKVAFEFAAPSVSGFDALAGSPEPATDALSDNATETKVEATAEATAPTSDDDIPF